jgi:hypothetical protein
MARIVRLTESDLTRLVRRVIMEQSTSSNYKDDLGNLFDLIRKKIDIEEFCLGKKRVYPYMVEVQKAQKLINIYLPDDVRQRTNTGKLIEDGKLGPQMRDFLCRG